jgi:hypothetical protein
VDGIKLHMVGKKDAQGMVGTRELAYVCRHCGSADESKKQCLGKVRAHAMVYVATPLYRDIKVSNASISCRELLANAGVIGSHGYQRAARVKVAYWREPWSMTPCAST